MSKADQRRMRHEYKYKIDQLHPAVVHQMIRQHPASFRKIYPDRQINNIYFDTPNYMAFTENVDGISERRKFRVRWYGPDIYKVQAPHLEIKIKSNQLGRKQTFPVQDFNLHHLTAVSKEVSGHSQLRLSLFPTLINSYQRSYYGTANGAFRMTIDWNLRYFSLLNATRFTSFTLTDEATVLELKYDVAQEKWEDEILQFIPFRQTKSSKYVTGMSLLKLN